jgi:hypothetical protein
MRNVKWIALVLVIGLAAHAALAQTPPAEPKKDAPAEIAAYSVPKIEEGTVVKDLGQALAETPGIVSATPDKEKGQLKVTFEPAKTNPEVILKALVAVNADVKLVGVAAADGKAAKHDCGKCPMAKSCAKEK